MAKGMKYRPGFRARNRDATGQMASSTRNPENKVTQFGVASAPKKQGCRHLVQTGNVWPRLCYFTAPPPPGPWGDSALNPGPRIRRLQRPMLRWKVEVPPSAGQRRDWSNRRSGKSCPRKGWPDYQSTASYDSLPSQPSNWWMPRENKHMFLMHCNGQNVQRCWRRP